MPLRRPRRVLLTFAVFALLSAPAAAQEPGVTVDPDTPAGRQYDLPLGTARQNDAPADSTGDAGGTPSRRGGGSEPSSGSGSGSALFGAGLEAGGPSGGSGASSGSGPSGDDGASDGGDASASSGSGRSSSSSRGASRRTRAQDRDGDPGAQVDREIAAVASQPASSSGSSVALLGGAGGALVLMIGAGLLLRRARSH